MFLPGCSTSQLTALETHHYCSRSFKLLCAGDVPSAEAAADAALAAAGAVGT